MNHSFWLAILALAAALFFSVLLMANAWVISVVCAALSVVLAAGYWRDTSERTGVAGRRAVMAVVLFLSLFLLLSIILWRLGWD